MSSTSRTPRIELFELLHKGLQAMNQPLTRAIENQLIRYIELIFQWNRVYNLTSIRDLLAMVVRHLLDSLRIKEFITGNLILDVGTGAGLPGIPLAMAMPECQFILLDSNQKKTRFLLQLKHQLHLHNIKIIHERIEDYYPDQLFDTVICRAFSTLLEFTQQIQHTLAPNAQLLAMKGVFPLTELEEVQKAQVPFAVTATHETKVPYLDAERHLVIMRFTPANDHG